MILKKLPLGICFFISAPLFGSTFSATFGSATITNAFGGPEGGAFHLTGPQVDVSGSGGSTPSFEASQLLNTPFNLNLNVLVNDIGGDSGSGVAGGITYPSLAFSGASLVVQNLARITLTTGNLTVTTAATLSGLLHACAPANFCTFGGGATTFPFDVNIAPISGLLTVTYVKINPPDGRQYALSLATFTTNVPEPSTWIAGVGLLGFFALGKNAGKRRAFKGGFQRT